MTENREGGKVTLEDHGYDINTYNPAHLECLRPDDSPQCFGVGIRATRPFKQGTVLGPVDGRVTTQVEQSLTGLTWDDAGNFVMESFDEQGTLIPNCFPLHLVNHSCKPNVEAVLVYDHEEYQEQPSRAWIVAIRDIAPGNQLYLDYGEEWAITLKMPCLCREDNCTGIIGGAALHAAKEEEESGL